jgi:hypothetical protein
MLCESPDLRDGGSQRPRHIQSRGLVDERDGIWYIVDPLFDEWPRRSSPLADPPAIEPPDDL